MGSISSLPAGLSILNQPGTGLFANLPVQLSAATLQSASTQDLVDLSSTALQLQQVDGIFGITPSQTAVTPQTITPSPTAAQPAAGSSAGSSATSAPLSFNLPSGIPAADLGNATPGQQAAIADAATQQQLVQNLFYPPLSVTSTVSLTG